MNSDVESSKKLLIDLTFLFDQYASRGIGRAGKEIVKRILLINANEKEFEIHLVGFNNLEMNLAQLEVSNFDGGEIKDQLTFHSVGEAAPSGVRNILRWGGWYGNLINTIKPDIFYALHFERGLPTAPIFSGQINHHPKTVVFYPDAIPVAMPNFTFSKKGVIQNEIKKWFYLTLLKGVSNADLVLTCSEFSKGDIVKFAHVPESKVKSIYLGIDNSFYQENFQSDQGEQRTALGLYQVNNKEYLFYDSGVEANKNTEALIQVLANLQEGDFPNYLVITGGDFAKGVGSQIIAKSPQARQFLDLAVKMNVLEKIITTDRLPEQHLKYLLFNASAYINLSTYEGFHFGPLQAMAAEIPAIASNTSCTPEVTKGGAYLVDLQNIQEAIQKIKDFLKDKELQIEYIKKGKEIVKEYNWDNTSNQTWEAITKL